MTVENFKEKACWRAAVHNQINSPAGN